jgi:hypothetical protein
MGSIRKEKIVILSICSICLLLFSAPFVHAHQSDSSAQPKVAGDAAAPAANKPADTKAPELPGAKTILLKPGEKLPQRVDPDYEDWNTPELPPHMKAEAVSLGHSDNGGFTRELVHVQWRQLDPIDLWLIKPKGGAVKPPVILYLYSSSSSSVDRYKDNKFCEFLTQKGFAAVGFVSAVSGQRVHDRPAKEWFVSELQESLATSVHDVQMILNYLGRRGDLDMTRVGMWGDGSGASIAIMAAAVDSRIKVLDLLDPWGDWPDWLAKSTLVPENQRAAYLTPLFLKKVANLDPVRWLPKVKTQQVRLQYIKEGLTVTPEIVRQKMEAATPSSVKIVHYESTKTFLADVGSKGTGFDWIKEKLGSNEENHNAGNQTMTNVSPQPKK